MEMLPQFKVGDRVVCATDHLRVLDIRKGDFGVIHSVYDDQVYAVIFENSKLPWYVLSTSLRLRRTEPLSIEEILGEE